LISVFIGRDHQAWSDAEIANAHAAMGSALLRVGLIDEAVEEFELALTTNPRHPEARRELDRLKRARRRGSASERSAAP